MIKLKLFFYPLLIILIGCGPDPGDPASLGERLFNDACAECHKETGKGNFIAGIPANATTQLGKEKIVKLIIEGLPAYPDMPSFPNLSEEEAGAVADHLLSIAEEE